MIEGPVTAQTAPQITARRGSFWRGFLIAIPTIVAIASTVVLGYYLISRGWQPQALLQAPQPVAPASPTPTNPTPQVQVAAPQPQVQPQQQTAPEVQEPDPPVPNPLPPMPSDDKLVILINSAVIALNQANATGNYTVLRDMAAPAFKRVNSPERLAQVFANLRSRNLDLSPVILYQPKLYQKPQMNDKGMLRITGFFPTAPERVNFDLVFQPAWGKWRLFGISANTQHVEPPPAAQPVPAAPATPAPAKPAKKPADKAKTGEAASKPEVDVRDRIDTSPPPQPAPEKPTQRSLLNPFGN
jgi:hypothetical protein